MARGVSIHAPAWGATRRSFPACRCGSCFNPRTRVGCDVHASRLLRVVGNVSIHAPAWGATAITAIEDGSFRVSIHAPAWGATTLHGRIRVTTDVSIHAPAWGATRARERGTNGAWCFNPRTRVGCDPGHVGDLLGHGCFNPRTRVGCDHTDGISLHPARRVSIHAPAWGATPNRKPRILTDEVSIHAPAWGATCGRTWPRGGSRVSIHAPAWGATSL